MTREEALERLERFVHGEGSIFVAESPEATILAEEALELVKLQHWGEAYLKALDAVDADARVWSGLPRLVREVEQARPQELIGGWDGISYPKPG